jgi:hypothetical protein
MSNQNDYAEILQENDSKEHKQDIDPDLLTSMLKDQGLDTIMPGGIHLARSLIDKILSEREKNSPSTQSPTASPIPTDPDPASEFEINKSVEAKVEENEEQ